MKEFCTAIRSKFLADGRLRAAARELYLGVAPPKSRPPYAVMVPVTSRPDRAFPHDYRDILVQFTLVSADTDVVELTEMRDAFVAVFDYGNLTFDNYWNVFFRLEEERPIRDEMEKVWTNVMDFRAVLQRKPT